MAADNGRMFTAEETLRALSEKAKEGDSFVMKVFRRAHMGAIPSLTATLAGAEVQHFTSPELWLPNLCGAGKYLLQGYHASDLNKPIAGNIQFVIDQGEARDVDGSMLKKPDWRGPPLLEYPKEIPRTAAEDLGPLYRLDSPSGPGPGDSATKVNQSWARQPGGGVVRQEYGGASGELFGRGAAALEAERRALEQQRRDLDLEKHKAEMVNVQKAHEADLRAFEAKFTAALSQAKPSGPDPMVQMLIEMTKQAAEDRRAAQAQQAEDRRAALAAQERADARFMVMIEKLNDKPKEKDPIETFKTFSELMGTKKDNGIIEAQTKMMHSMSEMMGQQVSTAMDFVNAAADLQLGQRGEEEPSWLKGVDRLIKGVGAMAKARAPIPQGPPPQLAQGHHPQPQPQQPQQPRQPQQPPQETSLTVVEQFEQAIRAKNPPEQIAKALITYAQEPSIQKALIESGGDFEAAFYKRLGNWHLEQPSNAEYLKALFAEVEKQLIAAGLVAPPEPEEDGGTDEGDEGDDE